MWRWQLQDLALKVRFSWSFGTSSRDNPRVLFERKVNTTARQRSYHRAQRSHAIGRIAKRTNFPILQFVQMLNAYIESVTLTILDASDYLNAFGTLQLDPASAPVSTNTVMWLASCTKLVTTVAALQCVERGLFDLHSPADIERHLPEWSKPEVLVGFEDGQPQLQPAKEKITLAQLLTNSSGLGYDWAPPTSAWRSWRGENPLSMRCPIAQAFQTPFAAEPGTSFVYGPSLDLVGLMVARANSCTLEEYMRKNIFSVLCMDDTSFHPLTHNNLSERLMPMTARVAPDKPLVDGEDPNSPVKRLPLDPKDEFGGGGLFGTAEDFLKLLKSLLRDDGKLLKQESVALMFEPALSASSNAALKEVLSNPGFATIAIPGEPVVGTPGSGEWTHGTGGLLGLTDKEYGLKAPWLQWGGAPNLKWWLDRKGGTCGIFATQLSPPGEAKHQVLTNLFQQEMVRKFTQNNV